MAKEKLKHVIDEPENKETEIVATEQSVEPIEMPPDVLEQGEDDRSVTLYEMLKI